MELIRLNSCQDPRYRWAMTLYGYSFPLHEQRHAQQQRQVMEESSYHFDLAWEENDWVGLILYWEQEDFIYVEHFCTKTAVRGRGYGQAILEKLTQKKKPIILEIDPPETELAQRRKGFYERAGFHVNPFDHVHPPYRKQYRGHKLVVMSHPAPLSERSYQVFSDYLGGTVMQHAE